MNMPPSHTTLILSGDNAEGERLKEILQEIVSGSITVLPLATGLYKAIREHNPDLLFVPLQPENTSGLDHLAEFYRHRSEGHSVAIVPEGNRDLAIKAMHAGAQAHIASPLDPEEVHLVVSRVLQNTTVLHGHNQIDPPLRESDGFRGMVGNTVVMRELFDLIARIGEEGETTVLLQGESGVGKELVAQALHDCSPRATRNFVPVNCAAIPDSLLESELFGYEKGAFTGATQAKKGRFQYASGGTLFLDEISEMRPELQAKLLRVLQEKEFEPVGGMKPVQADVRVIAATNINLDQAVAEGRFRTDLYYRLNVVPLTIPPLRDRVEDLPLLLDKFTRLFNRGKHSQPKRFSANALKALQSYPWPGNVRELKNIVQRLCVLHRKAVVHVHDLPPQIAPDPEAFTTAETRETPAVSAPAPSLPTIENMDQETDFNTQVSEFEDRLILQALIATNGNKKQAAEKLNLKRTTLLEKIKKKQLDKVFNSLQKKQA
ncbi:MAG: sigma 54-interacting transcriptional regulator [Thermodesulfobacteriota bacterium]